MRADLLLLLAFVALLLDSRRVRALARSTVGALRGTGAHRGIPAGADPDRVGITLRQIQMRAHVDWEDGGVGWDGPEILPVEDPDDFSAAPEPPAGSLLPVLWRPFPALPAAGQAGQPASTTSSPTATRPPATTAA